MAIGNFEEVRALAAAPRLLLVGGSRISPSTHLSPSSFAANKLA